MSEIIKTISFKIKESSSLDDLCSATGQALRIKIYE